MSVFEIAHVPKISRASVCWSVDFPTSIRAHLKIVAHKFRISPLSRPSFFLSFSFPFEEDAEHNQRDQVGLQRRITETETIDFEEQKRCKY